MTLRVDVLEQWNDFLPEHGGADERAHLKVPGTRYSYDFELIMPWIPPAQPKVLRVERKDINDLAASMFNGDKLARQTSYVDILIIEMGSESVAQLEARYDIEDVLSFQKRIARMCAGEGEYANLWVIPTLGRKGTLAVLRYIESGKATRAPNVPRKK